MILVAIIFAFLVFAVSWKFFQIYGPLKTLQTDIRVSTALYGPHSRFVAMGLYRMGMYYESQNEPEKALDCYRQIVDFPVCRHHPSAAPYYSKIGKLLFALGQYEEALEAFETCLTLHRKLEKAFFVLRLQGILHCIGQTHERLGNLEEALKIFEEAHTALVQRGYDRSVDNAKSLVLMARVLENMGKDDESIEKYQKALDTYIYNVGEFPRRKSIAELYNSIGGLHVRKGQIAPAVENYGMAVDVYRRAGKSDEDREMQVILRKMEDLKDTGATSKV